MAYQYDIIIVGSGIGGLVCGCYLAKAGLKVLIVEQHSKPGGYCTSFTRKGYSFDVGVHYLGAIKRGVLGKILDELSLRDDIRFTHADPTDKIIMPDRETYIRANPKDTAGEFKKSFPEEKSNIDKFFKFILHEDYTHVYSRIKKLSFQDVLDDFFTDYKLKATLTVLLGNIGIPANLASASSSIVLFREYILDSGHYPKGGMQNFVDCLVAKFKLFGGELLLSKKVSKISTENNRVKGVVVEDKEINAKAIVSNADATHTFTELLDMVSKESETVKKLIPTPSLFLVYLGLKTNLKNVFSIDYNIWYFSTYEINKVYSDIKSQILKDKLDWIVLSFPSANSSENDNGRSAITLMHLASYETQKFWHKQKDILAEKMMHKISEIIPNLIDNIEIKEIATPNTLYRYTSNRGGAFAGWCATREQAKVTLIPQKTSINGFYIVGHWATLGYLPSSGIPNVAFSGRKASKLIMEKMRIKWSHGNVSL